ncbi:hypothetical protein EJ05DRAFT_472466 [Pseudovirgaria hyperparasitica]|uniref:Galactose oxidase n=1 Tax=Pseudovirgaria hyperparasitica TaxID=470096 RepID=A0A6A6WNH4_9PEZI|nr:uncharacterized protein EJ05DRAFT_472466 [Pseudovirgaria hyperparasitica]KAF2763572.1 hypothetical protein EJ05DRAFT_472466 [Pseudovirgaria hyperparasitica]
MSLLVFVTLPILVALCTAQNSSNPIDPIVNFCSRFQHQSTVKNGVLYIDGGIQTYRLGGLNFSQNGTSVPSQLGINPSLITVGMNETWNWYTNITETAWKKETNPAGDFTPDIGVIRGSMFAGPDGDNKIYVYGGTTFMGNNSFPNWKQIQSDATPLWSYDTATNEWLPYSNSLDDRPNYGASAEATDKSMGFYLNGQVDIGSYYASQYLGNNTYNLPGMVIIHLNNQTLANISTPGLPDSYPRVGGLLQYLPNVGEDGVLVSLGGAYREAGGVGLFREQTMATFDSVDIFDLSSYLHNPQSNGTWYSQSTTGEVPPPMIDSCVVALSAPDNSSHNLYIYGGRNPMGSNITLYDGIWALSIPSFTWTKISGGDSPRWGHTCSVVGNRQLLTVSGSLNSTYDFCDWEQRGVAIFDLSTMLWGSIFVADDPAYNVSSLIVSTIGGTGDGGATLTSPEGGYDNAALEAVMTYTRQIEPTSSPSSKPKPSTIAGAVVGSLAGISLVAALACFLYRRNHKSSAAPDSAIELGSAEKSEFPGANTEVNEASGEDSKFEMGADEPRVELSAQAFVAYEMSAENEKKLANKDEMDIAETAPPQDRLFPNFSELQDVKRRASAQAGGGSDEKGFMDNKESKIVEERDAKD